MPRDPRMEKLLMLAAKSASFSWSQSEDGVDDLYMELWLWYMKRPSTQKKLQEADDFLVRRLAYTAALQILSDMALTEDEFRGNNLYSTDNVRDALEGRSKNRFLSGILPYATEALDKQNSRYAEAIRVRYEDRVTPADNTAKQLLKNAVKNLTKHVNILTIEGGGADNTNHTGPKLRNPIDPKLRAAGGEHSDPTANIAIMLMEHPELKDDYLALDPITEFTGPSQ